MLNFSHFPSLTGKIGLSLVMLVLGFFFSTAYYHQSDDDLAILEGELSPPFDMQIANRFPSLSVSTVKVLETPIKGLFAVTDGEQVVYVNEALTIAFRGNMEVISPQRQTLFDDTLKVPKQPHYEKESRRKSLPETNTKQLAVMPAIPNPPSKYAGLTKGAHTQALRNINFDHLIRFDQTSTDPNIRKTSMITFVDSSCPACKRLVPRITDLNQQGVTVYLAPFPRNGLKTNVAKQMLSAWCAGDNEAKKRAVLELFDGKHLFNSCNDSAVQQNFENVYAFAEAMLGGTTPVSFTDNGVTILANQTPSYFMQAIEFGYQFKAFSTSKSTGADLPPPAP